MTMLELANDDDDDDDGCQWQAMGSRRIAFLLKEWAELACLSAVVMIGRPASQQDASS